MKQYENMLLLDSRLEEQQERDLLKNILGMIERSGGRIVRNDGWGKRRCAYPVHKHTHAYYELVWFEGEPDIVDELKRQYRIMDGVLRYLIVHPTHPVSSEESAPAAEQAAPAATEEQAAPAPEAAQVQQSASEPSEAPAAESESTQEPTQEPSEKEETPGEEQPEV